MEICTITVQRTLNIAHVVRIIIRSHSSETGIEKCHVRFISYPSGRGQNVEPYYSK